MQDRTAHSPRAGLLTVTCSQYGLAKSTNGGGTSGASLTLGASSTLAASVGEGSFMYVTSDEAEFAAFFGFAPNVTSGTLNVNGDDAIVRTPQDKIR